jgi:rhamnosyltransferase
MEAFMKYAAIVILYNPDTDALERIGIYARNFSEVFVVDNSEVIDGNTQEKLRKYSNCTYKVMNGNEGIAKALYWGYSQVGNYDFVLTMDQDSSYDDKNIASMKRVIETNSDCSIAIFSANYSKKYFDKNINQYTVSKLAIPQNSIREVNFCMTSGSFVKVASLKEVLPLSDLFIGYVDNLLCYKLLNNQKKLIRVGCSSFIQQVGNDVNNNFFNRFFHVLKHSEIRYYYMIRNNLLLQQEFKGNSHIKSLLKVSLLRVLFNILIGEDKKKAKLVACIEGYKGYRNKQTGKISPAVLDKIY